MMLEHKIFDRMLIGQNIYSLLFAHAMAKSGKRTLLINDPRSSLGPRFGCEMGELTIRFLQRWGQEADLPPLQKIDQYLKPLSSIFFFANKRVYVSADPQLNLREFLRKVKGHGLTNESMEEQKENDWKDKLDQGVLALVELILKSDQEGIRVDQCEKLWGKFPVDVQALRTYIEQAKNEDSMQNFIYLLQTFYHFHMTRHSYGVASMVWPLEFILPRYTVDVPALEQDLAPYLVQAGVQIKNSRIEDLSIEGNRLSTVALNTYEGILYPLETFLCGYWQGKEGMEWNKNLDSFSVSTWRVQTADHAFKQYQGLRFLVSPLDRMGTEIPMWEIIVKGTDELEVRILYRETFGCKEQFFNQEIMSLVQQFLSGLFPAQKLALKEVLPVSEIYHDHWPLIFPAQGEKEYEKNKVKTRPISRMRKKQDFSSHHLGQIGRTPLSNVHYFGPLLGYEFGPLDYLSQVRLLL